MRRAVAAVFLFYSAAASAAVLEYSTEFRHDALDAEEETRDFFRERIRVTPVEGFSAGSAYSQCTSDGKKSFTWNTLSDAAGSPLYFIAGNFYAQQGSGLLYGKIRPYNPDPFAEEDGSGLKTGFSPCDSSNPSYSFYGAGASFYAGDRRNPLFILSAAHSRCVRYISAPVGTGSSTGDSASSILTHYMKRRQSDQPVTCTADLGSLVFNPLRFVRSEFSCMAFSISDERGNAVSWDESGSGYFRQSQKRIDAASFCLSYNDGLVKSFAETAACRTAEVRNGTVHNRSDFAVQGEVGFDADAASLSVRGKNIGAGFSSPFMSVFGSRTPSEGFFIGLKLSPFEHLSAEADGSAEKYRSSSQNSSAPAAVIKESIIIKAEVWDSLFLETSFKTRSDEGSMAPDRMQEKALLRYSSRPVSLRIGCAEQTSKSKKSYAASAGAEFISGNHKAEADAEGIWTRKGNSYLASAGDGRFLSVSRRAWVCSFGYSYKDESFRGKVSVSAEASGTALLEKRIECEASGSW